MRRAVRRNWVWCKNAGPFSVPPTEILILEDFRQGLPNFWRPTVHFVDSRPLGSPASSEPIPPPYFHNVHRSSNPFTVNHAL